MHSRSILFRLTTALCLVAIVAGSAFAKPVHFKHKIIESAAHAIPRLSLWTGAIGMPQLERSGRVSVGAVRYGHWWMSPGGFSKVLVNRSGQSLGAPTIGAGRATAVLDLDGDGLADVTSVLRHDGSERTTFHGALDDQRYRELFETPRGLCNLKLPSAGFADHLVAENPATAISLCPRRKPNAKGSHAPVGAGRPGLSGAGIVDPLAAECAKHVDPTSFLGLGGVRTDGGGDGNGVPDWLLVAAGAAGGFVGKIIASVISRQWQAQIVSLMTRGFDAAANFLASRATGAALAVGAFLVITFTPAHAGEDIPREMYVLVGDNMAYVANGGRVMDIYGPNGESAARGEWTPPARVVQAVDEAVDREMGTDARHQWRESSDTSSDDEDTSSGTSNTGNDTGPPADGERTNPGPDDETAGLEAFCTQYLENKVNWADRAREQAENGSCTDPAGQPGDDGVSLSCDWLDAFRNGAGRIGLDELIRGGQGCGEEDGPCDGVGDDPLEGKLEEAIKSGVLEGALPAFECNPLVCQPPPDAVKERAKRPGFPR